MPTELRASFIPDYIPEGFPAVYTASFIGSRVTCDPAPNDTDLDIIVLFESAEDLNKAQACLRAMEAETSTVGEGSNASQWASYKTNQLGGDEVNFILTANREFYNAFLLATHVSTTLNVECKEHRKTLFQAILYGEWYHPFGMVQYLPKQPIQYCSMDPVDNPFDDDLPPIIDPEEGEEITREW